VNWRKGLSNEHSTSTDGPGPDGGIPGDIHPNSRATDGRWEGGAIIAASDVTNDCGESLYEIESIAAKKSNDKTDGSFPGISRSISDASDGFFC